MGQELVEWKGEPAALSPLDHVIATRDAGIVDMVRLAIAERRMRMAYQPVIPAAGGQPAFHEGLLRLLDPHGRTLPAADFLPQVARSPLGRSLDALALDAGFEALAANPELHLAINFSARSIGVRSFDEALRRGLARARGLGRRMVLEIDERSAMERPEVVQDFMEAGHERGIVFAFDRFGAEMTVFRHLRDFYVDFLKIDAGFCRGLANDPDNRSIVAAIVAMAGKLGMMTIAQGLERADDVKVAQELGVDLVQGFVLGAPTLKPDWSLPRG